ncbi:transcriptional regulator [bacterium]|nr:MAG: transcriptional regulator [bacterium]
MKEIESHSVEFKRHWRDEYLKILCAFANSNGGVLWLGVKNDGTFIGLENVDKLLEELPNKIRNKLSITPSVMLEGTMDKKVIKIEISPSDIPISYNGKFYVRSGSTTQELQDFELLRFIMRRQGVSWDAMPSDVGAEEIDKETVDKFVEMAKSRLSISKADSANKILENLELIKNGKLTNAAVLLFTKEPQRYFLNSFVRVGRFKTPTEIIDTVEIKGNLFEQVEGIIKAIKKNINVKFEINDIERKEVWEYPITAIREACINALIHRDYLDSADVQIKIYDDHIWFWNPGKLPEGLTVEMLKKEHPSKLRNKLLAMVFYYAGLIERWGTGTVRMAEICRNWGFPEPEFKEESGGFSVIFWKDIYNEEFLEKMGLNERQVKAVLYVKEKGRITNREYQRITCVSKATATRDLSELVKLKILKRFGRGKKDIHYVLMSQKRANNELNEPKMMQEYE